MCLELESARMPQAKCKSDAEGSERCAELDLASADVSKGETVAAAGASDVLPSLLLLPKVPCWLGKHSWLDFDLSASSLKLALAGLTSPPFISRALCSMRALALDALHTEADTASLGAKGGLTAVDTACWSGMTGRFRMRMGAAAAAASAAVCWPAVQSPKPVLRAAAERRESAVCGLPVWPSGLLL